MTLENAIAIFNAMSPQRQSAVLTVFIGIAGAFPDVREAFVQAVADECLVVGTEMLLLQQTGVSMQ